MVAVEDRADGRMLPRIDISTGFSRSDSPGDYFGARLNQQRITAADFNPAFLNNPGYINNYRTRLNLTMPVYQGGALRAGRQKAGHESESSRLKHAFMRQQIIFQTISAYARHRQAHAAIKAMKSAVSAAKKRYQDTVALQRRGILIDSDVMDARVHLLRSKVKLREAGNASARAADDLRRVMGLDGELLLAAAEEPHLVADEWSPGKAVERALASRSDLKSLEQVYQAALAGTDYSRAAFLPHVNLVAGQEWNAATPGLKNRNSMIGATINLNLFSGGSDRAEMRAARAQQSMLEMKIRDLQQQIRNEVAHALRMLEESRMRYESETEALKQSEESLRIKSLRYKQGLATTSDVLDAQLQADQSRLAGIRSKYEIIIAQAAVLRALGILDKEAVR
jgi:outer membrane protein TolC